MSERQSCEPCRYALSGLLPTVLPGRGLSLTGFPSATNHPHGDGPDHPALLADHLANGERDSRIQKAVSIRTH